VALVALVAVGVPQLPLQAASRAQSSDAARASGEIVDGGWPRAYQTAAGAHLVVYQPQIASWDGRQRLVASAAVSYQATGAAAPLMGTVTIEGRSDVSLDTRLVKFSPFRITESHFSTLDRDELRDVVTEISATIPDEERVIALDRVLASLDKSQIRPGNVADVKADPPAIYYTTRSAVLVSFDGEPIWSPIKDNDLKFAVNTNWDVFQHEATRTFYLRHDRSWLE